MANPIDGAQEHLRKHSITNDNTNQRQLAEPRSGCAGAVFEVYETEGARNNKHIQSGAKADGGKENAVPGNNAHGIGICEVVALTGKVMYLGMAHHLLYRKPDPLNRLMYSAMEPVVHFEESLVTSTERIPFMQSFEKPMMQSLGKSMGYSRVLEHLREIKNFHYGIESQHKEK